MLRQEDAWPGAQQEEPTDGAQPPVALWKLLLAVVVFVLAIDLADHVAPGPALLIFLALVVALDIGAHRWGRDSRDGFDWKPVTRRRKMLPPRTAPAGTLEVRRH